MSESKQLEKIRGMSAAEQAQIIRQIEQSAYEYERRYGGCARCTLGALQDHLGLGDHETFAASTPFGAGIGRNGELCGALIGGLIAIGLAEASRGFIEQGSDETRPLCLKSPPYLKAGALTRKLCDRFREEYGGLTCREVMAKVFGRPIDMKDDKDRAYFIQPWVHDHCADVVKESARLTAEVLMEKD
jgi:C_GCAxxG_C_C family probable redox protein